jgi:hypothetical protein
MVTGEVSGGVLPAEGHGAKFNPGRSIAPLDREECQVEDTHHGPIRDRKFRSSTPGADAITDSYDYEVPFTGLLQDALALPIFDGGDMGIRQRQLHTMLKQATVTERCRLSG